MRLVVLSTVLPLVLGLTACVAPSEESTDEATAVAGEAAVSPDSAERAAAVVSRVDGLLDLNKKWNEKVSAGLNTPEARREADELVQKMREAVAAMPADAEWVTSYVQEHRDDIKAAFATEIATAEVRGAIGAAEVQKLIVAVAHGGGVDEVILKAASVVREHSKDVGDLLDQGKKMPLAYFCGMAGTVAGANAARENWRGVVVPMYVLLKAGCIR